jgi:hypothetical protein
VFAAVSFVFCFVCLVVNSPEEQNMRVLSCDETGLVKAVSVEAKAVKAKYRVQNREDAVQNAFFSAASNKVRV